eukprot:Rhum_TRINITY_DN8556_c0_g1::Rhum_TRINITY_DN8556_c0_g1_i1::g.28688::m.28688
MSVCVRVTGVGMFALWFYSGTTFSRVDVHQQVFLTVEQSLHGGDQGSGRRLRGLDQGTARLEAGSAAAPAHVDARCDVLLAQRHACCLPRDEGAHCCAGEREVSVAVSPPLDVDYRRVAAVEKPVLQTKPLGTAVLQHENVQSLVELRHQRRSVLALHYGRRAAAATASRVRSRRRRHSYPPAGSRDSVRAVRPLRVLRLLRGGGPESAPRQQTAAAAAAAACGGGAAAAAAVATAAACLETAALPPLAALDNAAEEEVQACDLGPRRLWREADGQDFLGNEEKPLEGAALGGVFEAVLEQNEQQREVVRLPTQVDQQRTVRIRRRQQDRRRYLQHKLVAFVCRRAGTQPAATGSTATTTTSAAPTSSPATAPAQSKAKPTRKAVQQATHTSAAGPVPGSGRLAPSTAARGALTLVGAQTLEAHLHDVHKQGGDRKQHRRRRQYGQTRVRTRGGRGKGDNGRLDRCKSGRVLRVRLCLHLLHRGGQRRALGRVRKAARALHHRRHHVLRRQRRRQTADQGCDKVLRLVALAVRLRQRPDDVCEEANLQVKRDRPRLAVLRRLHHAEHQLPHVCGERCGVALGGLLRLEGGVGRVASEQQQDGRQQRHARHQVGRGTLACHALPQQPRHRDAREARRIGVRPQRVPQPHALHVDEAVCRRRRRRRRRHRRSGAVGGGSCCGSAPAGLRRGHVGHRRQLANELLEPLHVQQRHVRQHAQQGVGVPAPHAHRSAPTSLTEERPVEHRKALQVRQPQVRRAAVRRRCRRRSVVARPRRRPRRRSRRRRSRS